MRLISLAFVTAVVAVAAPAAAAPFEPRTVPEEADAIGHVDVEALRRTQLFNALGGQTALDALLDDTPDEYRGIAKSLSRSIRSMSFWYHDSHGVVQVATNDARAVGQILAKAPVKQLRTVEGFPVYVPTKGGGSSGQLALVGDTVVLSDDAGSVDRAVRVLAGKAKSLAASPKLPSLGRQGVFFFVAIGDGLLGKIQQSAQSKLMQLSARSLIIDVSESGGQVVATARAEMKTADALQKAKSIADGLRALGSLSDDPRLVALLNGVSVTTAGLYLEVTAKAAAADLAKLVQSTK